ncbi:hypothetical protein C9374_011718 [Naegleria lovaniensis]|uniref:Methionyl/Valyl/Leucyl/Isoleucyl-tRNA synthetase anticodon-binding domain-containing protein n=1 Tax=Naegleria lovaniensis TaxID=51637 RepID=A0AA88KD39_NAELO|nr:uncharacterized protein C9374_011718 [Naegleria lovaniensis]KAG2373833.1 hypothetical protein C9374_011718 [Naegleria lovaniensis]
MFANIHEEARRMWSTDLDNSSLKKEYNDLSSHELNFSQHNDHNSNNNKLYYTISAPLVLLLNRSELDWKEILWLSRIDLAARFQILLGKKVIVKLGFVHHSCYGKRWSSPEEVQTTRERILKQIHDFGLLRSADIRFFNFSSTNDDDDINLDREFYRSFVRWQLTEMKRSGKIITKPMFQYLNSTNSIRYLHTALIVKMYLKKPSESCQDIVHPFLQSGKTIYLAVELRERPLSVFTISTCRIDEGESFGIFETAETNELIICREQSIHNLSYQYITPERGKFQLLASMKGKALTGSIVHSQVVNRDIKVSAGCRRRGAAGIESFGEIAPELQRNISSFKSQLDALIQRTSLTEMKRSLSPVTTILNNPTNLYNEKRVIVTLNGELSRGYLMDLLTKKLFEKQIEKECIGTLDTLIHHNMVIKGIAFQCGYDDDNNGIVALCDHYAVDFLQKDWYRQVLRDVSNRQTPYGIHNSDKKQLFEFLKNIDVCVCAKLFDQKYETDIYIPWDTHNSYSITATGMEVPPKFLFVLPLLKHYKLSPVNLSNDAWRYIFEPLTTRVNSHAPTEPYLRLIREHIQQLLPLDHFVSMNNYNILNSLFLHYALSASDDRVERMSHAVEVTRVKFLRYFMRKRTRIQPPRSELTEEADIWRLLLVSTCVINSYQATDLKREIYNFYQRISHIVTRSHQRTYFEDREPCGVFDHVFQLQMKRNIMKLKQFYHDRNYRKIFQHAWTNMTMIVSEYFATMKIYETKPSSTLAMEYVHYHVSILSPIMPHVCEYLLKKVIGSEFCIEDLRWPEVSLSHTNDEQHCLKIYEYLKRICRHKYWKTRSSTPNFKTMYIYVASHPYLGWHGQCLTILHKYKTELLNCKLKYREVVKNIFTSEQDFKSSTLAQPCRGPFFSARFVN